MKISDFVTDLDKVIEDVVDPSLAYLEVWNISQDSSIVDLRGATVQKAGDTMSGPLTINSSTGMYALSLRSTDAGKRPGIRQEAILPPTGIAFNMFEGYIGNDPTLLTGSGVIGILGAINAYPTASYTNFMYFGCATNAGYQHYALALTPNNYAIFTSGVNMGSCCNQ